MTHLLRVTVLLCMLFFGMTGPALSQTAPAAGSYETTLLPGEQWWDGLSHDVGKMPYTSQTKLARDMWGNNDENQAQPLLISSRGRYVWCNDPIRYSFNAGKLTVSSRTGAVKHGQGVMTWHRPTGTHRKRFPCPTASCPIRLCLPCRSTTPGSS